MVHFQEDGDAGYVIDVSVILPPLLSSSSDYGVSSLLRAVSAVEWPHNSSHRFVAQELPDTIRSYDNELVLRVEFESHHLWVSGNSDRMGDHISERSTHGKTGRILLLQPNSHGTQILAHTSFDGVDSTSDFEDSLLLNWHAWFVVFRQGSDFDAGLLPILRV